MKGVSIMKNTTQHKEKPKSKGNLRSVYYDHVPDSAVERVIASATMQPESGYRRPRHVSRTEIGGQE